MATPKKSAKADKGEVSSADKTSAAKAAKPAHVAPVVNLTQAAQSAALTMLARKKRAAEGDAAAPVNAAAFKQMKDSLAKPQFAAASPLAGLNKPAKPTGVAGYERPGGHHQNSSANVARTGVPRRTGGG